jgi:hypothetical protein
VRRHFASKKKRRPRKDPGNSTLFYFAKGLLVLKTVQATTQRLYHRYIQLSEDQWTFFSYWYDSSTDLKSTDCWCCFGLLTNLYLYFEITWVTLGVHLFYLLWLGRYYCLNLSWMVWLNTSWLCCRWEKKSQHFSKLNLNIL